MKKWPFLLLMLIQFLSTRAFARSPRMVSLTDSEVAVIHTGIGYSTILQFDAKPTSAVLGDQDAFKVEYVGNAITIKPLLASSKTNLFVFTDYDRFNFKLEAIRGADVDYLVQVKRKKTKQELENSFESAPNVASPAMLTKRFNVSNKSQGVFLKMTESSYSSQDGVYVLNFTLALDPGSKSVIAFEPGDVELIQSKKPVLIDNLYLEGLNLVPGRPLRGKLLLRESEFDTATRLELQFSPSVISSKGKKCPRVSFILKPKRK
jgi:hypothetical protein